MSDCAATTHPAGITAPAGVVVWSAQRTNSSR
ncbi:MYXO-CTERM sorting domain-containing protein [Lysobacter gummosus]